MYAIFNMADGTEFSSGEKTQIDCIRSILDFERDMSYGNPDSDTIITIEFGTGIVSRDGIATFRICRI